MKESGVTAPVSAFINSLDGTKYGVIHDADDDDSDCDYDGDGLGVMVASLEDLMYEHVNILFFKGKCKIE